MRINLDELEAMSERCNEPMHADCRCVRPLGHEGPHNCAYVSGAPNRPIRTPKEEEA